MLSIFLLHSALLLQHTYPTPDGKPPLCNFAKVHTGTSRAIVRSSHSLHSPLIARLANGTAVFTCDEWGDWDEIYFATPDHACRAATQQGLRETERNDCHQGWIPNKLVDIISG